MVDFIFYVFIVDTEWGINSVVLHVGPNPGDPKRKSDIAIGFKEAFHKVAASFLKVRYEVMSAIYFQTTVKENLPNFF